MQHTLSEAARLTGKDRTTIHRHIRSGKLSKGIGTDGAPYVETSELIRCYGELQQVGDVKIPQAATASIDEVLMEVRALRVEVATLSNRLEHKPNQKEGGSPFKGTPFDVFN